MCYDIPTIGMMERGVRQVSGLSSEQQLPPSYSQLRQVKFSFGTDKIQGVRSDKARFINKIFLLFFCSSDALLGASDSVKTTCV